MSKQGFVSETPCIVGHDGKPLSDRQPIKEDDRDSWRQSWCVKFINNNRVAANSGDFDSLTDDEVVALLLRYECALQDALNSEDE